VAKRSPILGYNHNVKYRGLVFHVQTEDSGLLNPHLFTHLFHGGVIVSTRKLVYDAGSAEDAIKALMQAQHKAVMKDLMKGSFDEKIDQYLSGTPGLEPGVGSRPSGPDNPLPRGERAVTESSEAPPEVAPPAEPSPPVVAAPRARASEAPVESPKPRTKTAERGSRGSARINLPPPPPPPLDDAPTLVGKDARVTLPTGTAAQPPRAATPPPRPPIPRPSQPPPIPARTAGVSKPPPAPLGDDFRIDSSSEIQISLTDEEVGARQRMPRDTAVEMPEGAVPTAIGEAAEATRPTDVFSVPRTGADSFPPPTTSPERRAASHGAAALPPMRSPSRPSITAPAVVARPVTPTGERSRRDSEAVEIYAPAPPSVESPPGERSERPGQYSVRRTRQHEIPAAPATNERPGRASSIPSGLGRCACRRRRARPRQ